MAKQVEHLKIFLASPGDVQTERDQARQAIEEINRTIGKDKNIHLDVVGWETDSYPAYGSDGQSLVNAQIANMDEYDLFLGIMWNRFGQPTPRADSGTEEEFNQAADAFERSGQPEIMVYFSQEASNLSTAEQLSQKGKVIQFKDRVRTKALTWDYPGAQSFQPLLQRHLSQWVLNRKRETPSVSTPPKNELHTPEAETSVQPTIHKEPDTWLLLNEMFYIAESVKTVADGTITLWVQPRDAEEEARLRSLNPQPYNRSMSVPYAYQNDGGLAQIKNIEMESSGGKTVFAVQLKLADLSQSGMMGSGVNNLSADDIAGLRAQLLLLDKIPLDSSGDNLSRHFISGFQSSVKVEKGIFPDFWKHMQSQPTLFLPLARLLAVYNLKASNTVEHVLELSVGPIKDNMLPVHFRGQRKRVYTNSAPAIIEVHGQCKLA